MKNKIEPRKLEPVVLEVTPVEIAMPFFYESVARGTYGKREWELCAAANGSALYVMCEGRVVALPMEPLTQALIPPVVSQLEGTEPLLGPNPRWGGRKAIGGGRKATSRGHKRANRSR